MEAPLFPAGEYVAPSNYNDQVLDSVVNQLATAGDEARQAVAGLDDRQLDTKYRNWTIRQIIHHLADSHINCYVRFKWALTEDTPVIKSYDESLWSEVIDAQTLPLECSLKILDGVHSRWAQLVSQLDDEKLQRGFFHPELDRVVTLREALPNYVWHTQHHLAQILWIREQQGW